MAGKDVLIEKPATSTYSESKKLINIARKKNKIIMVDHTFLFNKAVHLIKNLIEKNIKVTYNQLLHFSYCFDKSEYSEKLKTGSIFEVAEVMRDLLMLKQNKGLSFREFLTLHLKKEFKPFPLNDILSNHILIAKDIKEIVEEIVDYLCRASSSFFQKGDCGFKSDKL